MFWSKKNKVNTKRGSDNIRECDRALLAKFQAECEASGDYDALRCALKAARDVNFPVTSVNLHKFVTVGQYAEYGISDRGD